METGLVTTKRAVQFLNGGLQISRPVNRLADGKFLRLVNVRSYLDGLIQSRFGQIAITPAAIADTPIHTLRALHDSVPGAAQTASMITGAGTKLYTSDVFNTCLLYT